LPNVLTLWLQFFWALLNGIFYIQLPGLIFVYLKYILMYPTIPDLLLKFQGLNVLIVGDVMLDSYVWGNVSGISPEAPVPVLKHGTSENRLGGAANVALNIHSLGAVPILCSVIGTDDNGREFRNLMRKSGLSEEGLIETHTRLTTNKTRVFAGHQQLLRMDREVDNYIDPTLEELLWKKIQTLVTAGNLSAIVFQDYDKGVITPGLIEKIIRLGNERKLPTLVDPKKRNFARYRNATLFKPNFKELCEGLNLEIDKNNVDAVHDAARKLQEKSGFAMVMITLSEHGMLISRGKEFKVIPTQARDVADVSGAGDTVIAVASLCLGVGMDANDMAALANLAAGLVCERVGVVPVEKEWLINFSS
jgi:D-glycero-beta-D-manno-heptose-7-phosphate kinase